LVSGIDSGLGGLALCHEKRRKSSSGARASTT
jgi:hypothetical protein